MGWGTIFQNSRVLRMTCFPIFGPPQPFRPTRGPKFILFSYFFILISYFFHILGPKSNSSLLNTKDVTSQGEPRAHPGAKVDSCKCNRLGIRSWFRHNDLWAGEDLEEPPPLDSPNRFICRGSNGVALVARTPNQVVTPGLCRSRRHTCPGSAKYDQKCQKVQFLQNEHVPKFQECLFFRNKSPAGCTLT